MSQLPSGTVTFLFTDIERSTRLWEQHPQAMQVALARHDTLVRGVIEQHGGRVFKTLGDAFCAAFTPAAEGLAAALGIQRAIAAEAWDADVAIRVRIALHTGSAELRGGDYFGPALNRCARLLGVAHGGQTLISRVTSDLLPESLPDEIELKDLATHRLRDLSEPEHVYQLVHPALPSEFPPLASLDSLPNNLPLRPNRFVGRIEDVAAVKRLLERTKLLTLTGAGGSGKTRLALHLAADQVAGYPDGVWLIELAALDDPALVPRTVAAALGLREATGLSLTDTLIEYLRAKQVLLILDNCEHVVESAAHLAQSILRVCPGLRILATSREALGIAGEVLYLVPPLSVPASGLSGSSGPKGSAPKGTGPKGSGPKGHDPAEYVRDLLCSESVQLFVERATEMAPDFALTPANAPAVAEICRCLDGIALAIELAAARVRVLSPEQIAARLTDNLRLLTGGRRAPLPRQQTMRAAIDWSYVLLSEAERALLGRLAVFAGGWTLEMAEAVGAGGEIESWDVLDLLDKLVDKSLVAADAGGDARRFRMFEMIRQYAMEKLAVSGVEAAVRHAHLDWCLEFALHAKSMLQGSAQTEWLARLEAERDNLRAALSWSAAAGAEVKGMQLAAALQTYWYLAGYMSEGRSYLHRLLSAGEGESADLGVRASALQTQGVLAYYQGDYATARRSWEESLALRRTQGDRIAVDQLLNNLASVLRALGDYAAAREYFEQSLEIKRERGDRAGIGLMLFNLALLACDQGHLAEAHRLLDDCLKIQRELGDPHVIAASRCAQAGVMLLQCDFDGARHAAEQSLRYFRDAGTDYLTAEALEALAKVACETGDHAGARTLAEECLAIRRELGDTQGVADALTCLALVHMRSGDDDLAEPALREALALARDVAFKRGLATVLQNCGRLYERRADYASASASFLEALEIGRDLGSAWIEICTIELMVGLAVARGDAECALRLAGAAAALRREIEAPRPPIAEAEFVGHAAAAREHLDPTIAAEAWSWGAGLGIDAAIEFALGCFA